MHLMLKKMSDELPGSLHRNHHRYCIDPGGLPREFAATTRDSRATERGLRSSQRKVRRVPSQRAILDRARVRDEQSCEEECQLPGLPSGRSETKGDEPQWVCHQHGSDAGQLPYLSRSDLSAVSS